MNGEKFHLWAYLDVWLFEYFAEGKQSKPEGCQSTKN